MEQQQQLPPPHPQHHQTQEDPNGSSGAVVASAGSSKSSFLCRQSSTRWIPTTDQIRILKDLYYNSGVRSPSAEQIQRISARLRQYGKIEGKNVFYWFQNHKARERQKKRLTVDVPPNPPTPNTKFTTATLSPAGISPTSCALYGAAHHHVGTFRDYSLTSGVGGSNVIDGGMAWLGGMDNANSVPQHYYHQQQHRSIYYYEDSNCCYHYNSHPLHHQKEDEQKEARIETLPLFPIHAPEHKEQANAGDYESHGFYHSPFLGHPQQDSQVGHLYCNGNDAFLELTLNSYHPSHP